MTTLLTLAAAVAMTATEAPADTIDDGYDDLYDRALDEVVVTGTRVPKLLKDTPVQTVVITARDIESSDATDIEDLLQRELPGVEFSYAMNQQVHLNFGGFGGQSVLFLVDGERLAGETMDDVDFSRIEMADVERIEIVRGASSALYGGNAAGGVINVITREPSKAWNATAGARIGRHAEQRYNVSLGAKGAHVANALTATYSSIDSYDVHSSPDPVTRVVSTIYGNHTLNVKEQLTWRPVDALKLSARAGYFFREIPRVVDTPERYRDYSGGLRGFWRINRDQNIDVAYSYDQYDKSSYMRISDLDIRNYSNVTNSVRGVYNLTTGRRDVVTVGADYRYDYLDNTKIAGGARHEANVDVFGQYDWIIDDRWEVVGAARYDYFSSGDISRVTPKVSARFRASDFANVRLAYGMGFRTPTLKEKYYSFDMAGIWIVEGNEELKPESSHNVNVSFDWSHGGYNVTVTGYFNSVTDKISTGLPYYKPGEGNQLFLRYVNLDRYSVAGAEVALQGRWNCGLSARLAYAFVHENFPKDKDGNTANNQYIPAREHSLTARVEWLHEFSKKLSLTLGFDGRALSGVTNLEYKDYYDISAGTVEVKYPPYTLWRLSASTLIVGKVKVTLAVDNIFNYRPKYYYLNAPLTDGANFRAGVAVRL